MFDNAISCHRKESKSQRQRKRTMLIEALEERDLLSVSPLGDYRELEAAYSASFPISENANYIDVTELTVENLRAAIDQASQTAEDDVIVIHTTAASNVIDLGDCTLVFDVNSEACGSITLVSSGDSMLTISSAQQNVVQIKSGEIYFGGITFLAQESEGQSFQTDRLVVVSEGASADFSRTSFAVENLVSESKYSLSAAEQTPSTNVAMQADPKWVRTYEARIQVDGTQWAFITGLSLSDYNKLQSWVCNGTISYNIYSLNTGDFIDAEKDGSDDEDDYLCWAAAASNILWYTGWANPSLKDSDGNVLFTNEDDVFRYFREHFTNMGIFDGSAMHYMIEWFFRGEYNPKDSDFPYAAFVYQYQPDVFPRLRNPGGGFYPNISKQEINTLIGQFEKVVNNRTANINLLAKGLENGCGVGLDLERVGVNYYGHAITAWGFMYDTSIPETNPSHYLSLFVTDSDNDHYSALSGADAANRLRNCPLTWSTWNDYFGSYQGYRLYGDEWYLKSIAVLNPIEKYVDLNYCDNDFSSLRTFLEQTDSNGVKNGKKLNSSYSANDPTTWEGVSWAEIDGQARVTKIRWNNKQLAGSLNVSNCTALTALYCQSNQLTFLNASGCTALTDLYCDSNQITVINVSGCPNLNSLSCWNDSLERIELNQETGKINVLLTESDTSWTFRDANGVTLASNAESYRFSASSPIALPITAVDAMGAQTITLLDPSIVPLAVPRLSVTVTGYDSVSVTVGAVSHASDYQLEYSTNPNFTSPVIKSVSAGSTPINNLISDTTYYFRVMAIGKDNYSDSDYSATVSAKTEIELITLSTPGLNVTASNSSITATWSTVANASSYTVEYKLNNSQWSVLAADTRTTSISINRQEGKHSFRVKANGTGNYLDSDYSAVKSVSIGNVLVAEDDSVKTKFNAPVRIDYLANDESSNWSATNIVFGNASHGSFIDNLDGSITYTPNDGFFGMDTIEYELRNSSGKRSSATITVYVGLPVVSSVQKDLVNHTPSTAIAPSVESLTDWDICYIELWGQGVHEVNASKTVVTLSYNPSIYSSVSFTNCANGVVMSASQGVELPNGNVQVELTVETTQTLVSETDNLYLGTVVLTPSTEQESGVSGASASATLCTLDGMNLTTTVTAMPYDLSRNGSVDVNDFIAFATVYGLKPINMSSDHSLYAQAVQADFNKDGVINVDDFVDFAQRYGASKKSSVNPQAQPIAQSAQANDEDLEANVAVCDSDVLWEEAAAVAEVPLLVSENKTESFQTLREAYSAALLDLYDNQERAELSDFRDVLVDSRTDALPTESFEESDSQPTASAAIDSILQEELLEIDWKNL